MLGSLTLLVLLAISVTTESRVSGGGGGKFIPQPGQPGQRPEKPPITYPPWTPSPTFGPPSPTPPAELPSCKCCIPNVLVVEGATLTTTNAQDCQDACQASPSCQFFTYNEGTGGCGLRTFEPTARAFSFGNLSGFKYESPTIWTQAKNTVLVGRLETTSTCVQCLNLCITSPGCKTVIYNQLFGECSLNYGTGSLISIALPPIFDCFGISSAINCSSPPFCL